MFLIINHCANTQDGTILSLKMNRCKSDQSKAVKAHQRNRISVGKGKFKPTVQQMLLEGRRALWTVMGKDKSRNISDAFEPEAFVKFSHTQSYFHAVYRL